MIDSYSQRPLTVAGDKLPAISAIASEVAAIFDEKGESQRYLAGLWDGDIINGLLWSRNNRVLGEYLEPVAQYRAPSWSWASVDGAVRYDRVMDMGDQDWSYGPQPETTISAGVTFADPVNVFGEITDGSMVLVGDSGSLVVPPAVESLLFLKNNHFERQFRGEKMPDDPIEESEMEIEADTVLSSYHLTETERELHGPFEAIARHFILLFGLETEFHAGWEVKLVPLKKLVLPVAMFSDFMGRLLLPEQPVGHGWRGFWDRPPEKESQEWQSRETPDFVSAWRYKCAT
jgi:hypothetical protein